MPTTMHFLPPPKMVRTKNSSYREKEIDNGSDGDTNTFLTSNKWKVSDFLSQIIWYNETGPRELSIN